VDEPARGAAAQCAVDEDLLPLRPRQGDRGERIPPAAGTNTIAAADTEQRSYWYVQGEYEQDESRSDAENDEAFVSELKNSPR
jgi:hypothetical protein